MTKIRLSLSENPYKIPKKTINKLYEELPYLNLYPHDYYNEIKDIIACYYGYSSKNVYLSNGSDEMIFLCLLKYGNRNKKILLNEKTFMGYKHSANALKTKYIEVKLENYKVNIKNFYNYLNDDISLVYICNPHNPTGTVINKYDLEAFINRCEPKDIMVVVDEAYMDYCDDNNNNSVVDLLPKYKNLIVIKTLSKIFPMAGIRFGFALSQEQNIANLSRFKMLPYSVNRIACIMAIEFFKNNNYRKQIIESNKNNKYYLYNKLVKLGLSFIESETNFIMIKKPDIPIEITKYLKELYGIEVLDLKTIGYDKYIRVTIGTKNQIDYFITSTNKILLDYVRK